MATLPTGPAGGDQTQTSSPQTATVPSATRDTTSFQPTTLGQQLDTSGATGGVVLTQPPLPAIQLNSNTGTVSTYEPPQQEINYGLAALSVGLFLVAILLFWVTAKSAKNTTY